MWARHPRGTTAICCVILLLCLALAGPSALASIPYRSYTYDYWGEAIPAPQAYVPTAVIDGQSLGIGDLSAPEDVYASDEYGIYIVDTRNSRLICLDHSWQVTRIIDEFLIDGKNSRFKNPTGVFVDQYGQIYVADQDNSRVVVLDSSGAFVREIGTPVADYDGVIPEGFRYIPSKVGVDRAGRVYVIGREVFDGLMQFDSAGRFAGFVGAPRVSRSLIDVFWRMIATREQRERLSLFLPTEYSNLDVDEDGFIYATASGTAIQTEQVVRRLNAAGEDVLRRMGFTPPVGDSGPVLEGEPVSRFVDITARDNGMYTVLDQSRGRLFTYNANGHLLYTFGGIGDHVGAFRTPVAVARVGDDIAVLDRHHNRLTVFSPTEYARYIHLATEYYDRGLYDYATEMWQRVLALNANYDLAYTGIGDALLHQGRFKEAMENFRLGQNRDRYSKAFGFFRQEAIWDHFGLVASIVAIIVVGWFAVSRIRPLAVKRRPSRGSEVREEAGLTSEPAPSGANPVLTQFIELGRSLRFAGYVALHPFDGFAAMKHEGRGSTAAASVILLLLTFTYISMRQYTGFVFNHRNLSELNVLSELLGVVIPVALWCLVSWSLTTLMEGKGSPKEIFIATGYAVIPAIIINLPLTALSNFMTLPEGTFYYLLLTLSVIWTAGLLFIGMMTIHDYSFAKTAFTAVLTLVGIGFVLFLGLLFVTLMDEVVKFVTSIYFEISYRL